MLTTRLMALESKTKEADLKPQVAQKNKWGSLGFGSALIAILQMLALSCPVFIDLGPYSYSLPIIIIAMVAILLFSASFINDFLSLQNGLLPLKTLILVGAVFSFFIFANVFVVAGVIGSAIFIASSILVWGNSLAMYERSELLLATALSFAVAGIVSIISLSFSPTVGWVATGILAIFSGIVSFPSSIYPSQNGISIASSRLRGSAGRGNTTTIIAIGMCVGVSIVMAGELPFSMKATTTLMGASALIAGVITALLRGRFKKSYEHFFRRTIAVVAVLTILPYPFVGSHLRATLIFVILMHSVINCIILIDAIATTAYKKRLSPYWIIGKEGSIFFLGFAVTLLVFSILLSNYHYSSQSNPVAYLVFTVIFVALQVFVEGQSYPYFERVSERDLSSDREKSRPESDLAVGGGARWRERMDEIAAEYKLSPRQQEVMRLLLKGRDVKYIMNKFVISKATARTHVYNLYKKLGVHSRGELTDLIEQPTNK